MIDVEDVDFTLFLFKNSIGNKERVESLIVHCDIIHGDTDREIQSWKGYELSLKETIIPRYNLVSFFL